MLLSPFFLTQLNLSAFCVMEGCHVITTTSAMTSTVWSWWACRSWALKCPTRRFSKTTSTSYALTTSASGTLTIQTTRRPCLPCLLPTWVSHPKAWVIWQYFMPEQLLLLVVCTLYKSWWIVSLMFRFNKELFMVMLGERQISIFFPFHFRSLSRTHETVLPSCMWWRRDRLQRPGSHYEGHTNIGLDYRRPC